MKINLLPLIVAAIIPLYGFSEEKATDSKNITIIQGQSTADGKSQLAERLLEECIVSLPDAETVEPIVSSQSQFLKEINGDPSKNDFVKTFSASLEINYMIHQKVLIVVTTNAIQGQEPVMKVMEKNLQQTKRFVSDAADGDLYAGRSRRQYYFSTPEGAKKDVQKRAAAWIKQQAAIICPK
ncbi:MAG: hypothetical protein JXA18_07925 [Chitinispirillaceae bacterium]|nr:hypothetical protein [Chitinispirillaceae bacterium]